MAQLDNAFLDRMKKVSQTFNPAWVYIKDDKQPDGQLGGLRVRWRAGVPCLNQDEQWSRCYVAFVGIAVSVGSDGKPLRTIDLDTIVPLCQMAGMIAITDKRIVGVLSAGRLANHDILDGYKIVFSLNYSAVTNLTVESIAQKKILGGSRVAGVKVFFGGANLGGVTIEPKSLLIDPWDAAKRRAWMGKIRNLSVGEHLLEGTLKATHADKTRS